MLDKAAGDTSKSLYDRNQAVYELLRYGVKVKPDVGENTQTVWLIDWKHPEKNDFAIAEEVTVLGADAKAHQAPRHRALRQRHRARRAGAEALHGFRGRGHPPEPRQPEEGLHRAFFSTMQLVMAGNDTEGLRYGTIETPEKYYLTWKEDRAPSRTRSTERLIQICGKAAVPGNHPRLHRVRRRDEEALPPQPVFRRAGRAGLRQRREGGIIWHTQGPARA